MLAVTTSREGQFEGVPQPTVHLVNPLTDLFAGAERHTLHLFDLLKNHGRIRLWAEGTADPRIQGYPIRRIRPWRLRFPRGGTIVFIGVFFPIGRWVRFSRPERIILVYNTPSRDALHERHRRFQRMFPRKVEIVYVSKLVEQMAGLPGTVEYAAMNFDGFSPRSNGSNFADPNGFTIGRLSRPVGPKHHPGDCAFYRGLAKQGYRVRLMGIPPGMAVELQDVSGIEILAQGAEDAAEFLRGLDCFFYHTAEDWLEPWGRVVCEAMACGLPVVCGRAGGYSDIIEQGCNGFLFDDKDEALGQLEALRRDPQLRSRIGAAARQTIESFYSAARRDAQLDFYLARKSA